MAAGRIAPRQHTFPFDFLFLAAGVYLSSLAVARVLPGTDAPDLVAAGLTADLTILVPALYYWLGVRRRSLPLVTVVPVFVASLFAASRIVPAEHQQALNGLKQVLVVLELGIFAFVFWTLRRAVAQGRQLGDRLEGYRHVLSNLMPARAAEAIAYELATVTYALAPRQKLPSRQVFTYHKRGAVTAIAGALLLAVVAEAVPVHLLLSRWSPVAAWIHLALSAYGLLWIVGDTRAMSQRPIELNPNGLHLRLGLRWSLAVPWDAVAELTPQRGAPPKAKTLLSLLPLGSQPTHRLHLRRPLVAQGVYGLTKTVQEVVFCVDEVERFEERVRGRLPTLKDKK